MLMPAPAEFEGAFAAALERLRLYVDLRMGPALRANLEPDDVLQEAFLEGARAFDAKSPREPRAFAAWMCRITENLLRGQADRFAARKRRPTGPVVPLSGVAEFAAGTATGPVTAAARNEANERLRAALQAIDVDERDVLLRRYFAAETLDEIATASGRSITAVRRLLARATTRLGGDLLDGGSR